MTESLPPGLSLVSIAGTGWACSGSRCTRADVLGPGVSWSLTVTANVANAASGAVTNQVSVAGGGSDAALAIDPTLVLPVAGPPVISTVNVAGGGSTIAQNTWLEIKGHNLVPGNTQSEGVIWNSAPEFASGAMPTLLSGIPVTVKVNNKAAFLYYFCSVATSAVCAADQINVLTPLDNSVGPVQVTVSYGGNPSAPYTATMNPVAPSLLTDRGYVVATDTSYQRVGPVSLSAPGYPFHPASPGESVSLWAVGFGLPSNPLVNGSATQVGSLLPLPSCEIGGLQASVGFAGLVGPGLYQINVTVPNLVSGGDQAVVCTYRSVSTPLGTLITVQ